MEKTLVVGMFETATPKYEMNRILEEMDILTRSAGGYVLGSFFQRRQAPDKRYLIGKGKCHEIKNFAYARDVQVIIFYNSLSNVQQRNLERLFKLKVIDRTRLILDVFATRARSLEGKLQVELAQLLYLLPRLTGKGVELSRLGGGIGTRGPGETKLEADRRTINKRISIIKHRLDKVIKSRNLQRKNRQANPIPVVSLVGYTSAGKSTLFKTLTGEDVIISPLLFSTLDPLLRRVEMNDIENGYCFLLADTVGFIRHMPRELFQAFKATLEEMVQADIILHVIDCSDPDYLDRKLEVEKVLQQLNIPQKNIIPVYNKVDLLPKTQFPSPSEQDTPETDDMPDTPEVSDEFHHLDNLEDLEDAEDLNNAEDLNDADDLDDLDDTDDADDADDLDDFDDLDRPASPHRFSFLPDDPGRLFISAKEGTGLQQLKRAVFQKHFSTYQRYRLRFPQDVLNPGTIHHWAIVVSKSIKNKEIELEILCSRENMLKFKEKYGGYVI